MQIVLDLAQGKNPFETVTQSGMQKNIDAVERALAGKPSAADMVLLTDTLLILKGIQLQLQSDDNVRIPKKNGYYVRTHDDFWEIVRVQEYWNKSDLICVRYSDESARQALKDVRHAYPENRYRIVHRYSLVEVLE